MKEWQKLSFNYHQIRPLSLLLCEVWIDKSIQRFFDTRRIAVWYLTLTQGTGISCIPHEKVQVNQGQKFLSDPGVLTLWST